MRTDDPPLDGTLKWRYAVRHEPHDVRRERTRRLLDELGKLRSAAAADGQHYYWAD